MKYLSRDSAAREALNDWAFRNLVVIEETREMPERGEHLLLSRLAVLSVDEFIALWRTGVEIVTCDGIDTRACKAVGEIQTPAIKAVVEALTAWGVTGAPPPAPAPPPLTPTPIAPAAALQIVIAAGRADVEISEFWRAAVVAAAQSCGANAERAATVGNVFTGLVFGQPEAATPEPPAPVATPEPPPAPPPVVVAPVVAEDDEKQPAPPGYKWVLMHTDEDGGINGTYYRDSSKESREGDGRQGTRDLDRALRFDSGADAEKHAEKYELEDWAPRLVRWGDLPPEQASSASERKERQRQRPRPRPGQ